MERTWKPTVAGVLCIISGAIGIILGLIVLVASNLVVRLADITGGQCVFELVITIVMALALGPICWRQTTACATVAAPGLILQRSVDGSASRA